MTLRADKTQAAPEIEDFLRKLGNKSGSIPFYAIFPADDPNRPILLDGIFMSPQPIIKALKEAGPSRNAEVQMMNRTEPQIIADRSAISLPDRGAIRDP